jgi:hypothetical protein
MLVYKTKTYQPNCKPSHYCYLSINQRDESDTFILDEFDTLKDGDFLLTDTYSTLDKSALERDQW